jgi:hypothetical protein
MVMIAPVIGEAASVAQPVSVPDIATAPARAGPARPATECRHGFPRSHGPPESKVNGPRLTLRCCPR